jgi:DNA-binding MarR family transcriptional regulator
MILMKTEWLNEDEMTAWVRLAGVMELLPGVLDSHMRREADLTQFEYYVLAMLSESPEWTLRMTELAARTNATLPRLSHVVRRLEDRGLVDRLPCPGDGRATNVRLTDHGWGKIETAAPGHVAHVRSIVFDVLTPEQVDQLATITGALLTKLDPHGGVTPVAGRLEPAGDAAAG